MTDIIDDRKDRRNTIANWMIGEASSIVISGHRDPDQDSLGSQIAMHHVLKDSFPDKEIISIINPEIVTMLVEGGMTEAFRYLNQPGVTYANEVLEYISENPTFDLFIGLDCATYDRLPEKVQDVAERCRNQLFFDHHPSEDSDRKFNVVNDPGSPSTTSLLYDFFKDLSFNDYRIPSKAYNALYFGLVGDTGNFVHSDTDSYALNLAGTLSENMSVSPSEISRMFRQRSFGELESSADVIIHARRELDDQFVYYIHGDPNDLIAEGFSSTNNPVDMLTMVRGYQVAMTALAIDDERFRVSIRSSGRYKVNDVASRYHGGGHDLAAGCVCTDKELTELIRELRDRVKVRR